MFYWRSHLAVLLASAVGTTILVGSLIVGDSVRHSMQQITLQRLGTVEYAVESGDRYFRISLADAVADELNTQASSVLHVQGVAAGHGDKPPVGQVQVYGVLPSFEGCWQEAMPIAELQSDEAIVNSRLAEQLGIRSGDEILLRVENANLSLLLEVGYLLIHCLKNALRHIWTRCECIATLAQVAEVEECD